MNKVVATLQEAVQNINDGATVAITGVGTPHVWPTSLMMALRDKGSKDLTLVCNFPGLGPVSAQMLIEKGQVKKVIASQGGIAGMPAASDELFRAGKMELEISGQGVLMERLNAASAGVPAFYSPVGLGTMVAEGKETRVFNGREYLLETAIVPDFALIRAAKADTAGNIVYHGMERGFSDTMAKAAKFTIAEVDEIVEAGMLDPDFIHTPGIYVNVVVKSTFDRQAAVQAAIAVAKKSMMVGAPREINGKSVLSRELVGLRASMELESGQYVNIGFGLPQQVVRFVAGRDDIVLHAELGMLGYGTPVPVEEMDMDIYDAGASFVGLNPGACFCAVRDAHGMARSGRVNVVMLGAFQVSEKGDLANIMSPKVGVPGVGGAMDLVSGGAKVIVCMEHLSDDGEKKIKTTCDYPLTALGVVSKIITDLAVIDVTPKGLVLKETAPGWTAEEIQELTEAKLIIDPNCKEMSL